MNNSLLMELTALVQETAQIIACPEPDIPCLENYGQRRREIFFRLQHLSESETQGEAESLRAVLTQLHEQDRLLLPQLAIQRARCREELLMIAKARQAAKDSTPSFAGRLFERRC